MPLIRRKIENVKAAAPQGSRFSAKQLDAVLKNYPRDELFQISEADLSRISSGVLRLLLRPRTRLFIRRDRFDRYVSALLYTPRDSYNSELRTRAHKLLAEAYGGRTTAFYPSFGEGPLARVHLIIGLDRGHPEPDEDALDLQMRQLFETWEDALIRVARSTRADQSLAAHANFTAAYKEAFQPEEGLADLLAISGMSAGKALRARVWGPDFEAGISRVKIYHRDQPLDLAEIVPVLERMGLRVRAEVGYPIRFSAHDHGKAGAVYVHDLAIDRPAGQKRLMRASNTRSKRSGAARPRTTVSTASSSRWGQTGAPQPCCARSAASAASQASIRPKPCRCARWRSIRTFRTTCSNCSP